MKTGISSLLFAIAMMVGIAGCQEAKEVYNCAQICETYGDCAQDLGQDVDVTQCISDCEDAADRSPGFAQTASECQQCLQGVDECIDAFPCVDECAGVVPEIATM